MSEPRPGTPGSENTPKGDGPPAASDRTRPGAAPPPASNQGGTASIDPAQEPAGESGTVGSADPGAHAPGDSGTDRAVRSAESGHSGVGGASVPSGRDSGDRPEPGAHDPERGVAPGTAHRQPDSQGSAPPGAMADDDQLGAIRTRPGDPPQSIPEPVPTPGNAAGVSVPAVEAAEGTSEDDGKVTGVRATALAPPGKPDGEVDTRR